MGKDILAADIGGTSARFGRFTLSPSGTLERHETLWLRTGEASSFAELLSQLEKSSFPLRPRAAAICIFAAAGPIEEGTLCSPPNIPWKIDLRSAQSEFGIKRFGLLNDFLAQAFACRSPVGKDAREILPGKVRDNGVVAVIGAGTGLGKAMLVPDGEGAFAGASSEGGHANIAIESPEEFAFHEFVRSKIGAPYVTWDEVVSGRGLSAIHEFLTGERLSPSDVTAAVTENSDTFQWFSRFYGRVCRNFALEVLAFGGLYIAGGVAAKNTSVLTDRAFAAAFYSSKVHHELLKSIPVYLLGEQESGLWGAAFYGLQRLSA